MSNAPALKEIEDYAKQICNTVYLPEIKNAPARIESNRFAQQINRALELFPHGEDTNALIAKLLKRINNKDNGLLPQIVKESNIAADYWTGMFWDRFYRTNAAALLAQSEMESDNEVHPSKINSIIFERAILEFHKHVPILIGIS